jgi:hypothetical protein
MQTHTSRHVRFSRKAFAVLLEGVEKVVELGGDVVGFKVVSNE